MLYWLARGILLWIIHPNFAWILTVVMINTLEMLSLSRKLYSILSRSTNATTKRDGLWVRRGVDKISKKKLRMRIENENWNSRCKIGILAFRSHEYSANLQYTRLFKLLWLSQNRIVKLQLLLSLLKFKVNPHCQSRKTFTLIIG